MTPAELTAARKALRLTAADLGRALQLAGRDPGRYVVAWEKGVHPIPGPAAVAIGYMLAEQARQGLQEAVQEAQAFLRPDPTGVVFTDPQGPDLRPLHQRVIQTRRRGT
jgi:hypothetical protein